MQKQFQLMYSPESLEAERASWRSVVYFNIARSVKLILEVLELYGDTAEDDSPDMSDSSSEAVARGRYRSTSRRPGGSSIGISGSSASSSKAALVLENQRHIAMLRLKLAPLIAAEALLADKLSGGMRSANPNQSKVFARRGWQSLASFSLTSGLGHRSTRSADGIELSHGGLVAVVQEVAAVLDSCKSDISALWRNETTQKMIKRRRLRLEDSAG